MKLKIGFSVLVIAIVSIALYDFSQTAVREEMEARENSLKEVIDLEQIVEMKLFRNSKLQVEIRKNDSGEWAMVSPQEDYLDRSAVMFFISDLISDELTLVTRNQDGKSNDGFGADKIVFSKAAGGDLSVQIGPVSDFDQSTFLKVSDREGVFVGGNLWDKVRENDGSDLRLRTAFQFIDHEVEIVDVKIKIGSEAVAVSKVKDGWSFNEETLKEEKLVSELLDFIGNLKALNLIGFDKSDKVKELFKVFRPSVIVELEYKRRVDGKMNNELWKMELGQPHNGYVFADVSGRPGLLRFDENKIKELISLVDELLLKLKEKGI